MRKEENNNFSEANKKKNRKREQHVNTNILSTGQKEHEISVNCSN